MPDEDSSCNHISVSACSDHICFVSNGHLCVYDCLSKRRTQRSLTSKDSEISAAGFCPRRRRFYTCSYSSEGTGSSIAVFGEAERRVLARFDLKEVVLRVLLNSEHICAVSDASVTTFSARDFSTIKRQETVSNPSGCCAVSTDPNRSVICCLGLQRGTVRLERPSMPSAMPYVIAAHESAIAAVALSGNGMFVSTSSEAGSVVRVHATRDKCDLIYEIQRSSMPFLWRNPQISRLKMNFSGSYLAFLDDLNVISLYRSPIDESEQSTLELLEPPSSQQEEALGTKMSVIFRKCIDTFTSSHARVELPDRLGDATITDFEFSDTNGNSRLVVATQFHGIVFDYITKIRMLHCGNLQDHGDSIDEQSAPDEWVLVDGI